MTQKDKELLLKDLCARLPYRVKCRIKGERSKILIGIDPEGLLFRARTPDKSDWCYDSYDIEEWSILPYLRPMLSMTEDERKEYNDIVKNTIDFYDCQKSEKICFFIMPIDWLNKHHFDYRGLIKKGLALEAPEGMYEY